MRGIRGRVAESVIERVMRERRKCDGRRQRIEKERGIERKD